MKLRQADGSGGDRELLVPPSSMWRQIRFRSTGSVRHFGHMSRCNAQSNIPLISPLFNHRLLGKSHMNTSIDEEAILELLQMITPSPVPASKYPYHNLKGFPRCTKIPAPPATAARAQLVDYVDLLTSHRYPIPATPKIADALLEIVQSTPELLGKEEYLKIILFLHYVALDKIGFRVLNLMIENTALKQDIDFDNIFLSQTVKPWNYRKIIERLEILKDREVSANINTWYYMFNMFQSPEPKVEMVQMMKDLNIPLKPIVNSFAPIVDYYTPEKINEMYENEGISIERGTLTSSLFNNLVACYLKDNRAAEIWSLIEADVRYRKMINIPLFVTFMHHFFKNNQVAYAFAFAKYLRNNHNLFTSNVLASMMLNVYLKDCSYFELWLSVVRILYPNKNQKVFLNTKTKSNLMDYCLLHKLDADFKMGPEEYKLRKEIDSVLNWTDKPIFEFAENTKQFRQLAEKMGQHK